MSFLPRRVAALTCYIMGCYLYSGISVCCRIKTAWKHQKNVFKLHFSLNLKLGCNINEEREVSLFTFPIVLLGAMGSRNSEKGSSPRAMEERGGHMTLLCSRLLFYGHVWLILENGNSEFEEKPMNFSWGSFEHAQMASPVGSPKSREGALPSSIFLKVTQNGKGHGGRHKGPLGRCWTDPTPGKR